MLKPIAILTVSGTLGGVGLYYEGGGRPAAPEPLLAPYLVEVGVVFPEAAVRAALPQGIEPAPGFTGGIAVYGGQEGHAGLPHAAGYVWLDVEAGEGLTRYRLKGFTSEAYEDTSTAALDASSTRLLSELGRRDILHVVTWPDQVSGLELVVSPSSEPCSPVSRAQNLIAEDPATEGQGMIVMPVLAGWCVTEAEVAVARITAPPGHPLRPFVPQQVLWAEIARPVGEAPHLPPL